MQNDAKFQGSGLKNVEGVNHNKYIPLVATFPANLKTE